MVETTSRLPSGFRDSRERSTVREFLESRIENGSSFSVISPYITNYALEALKSSLIGISDLRFIPRQ